MSPAIPDALNLLIRAGLSAVLAALAMFDLRHRRVPNWIVRPLLLGGTATTLARLVLGRVDWEALAVTAAAWLVCLGLWHLRVFGGGDMKLVMALMVFAPDIRLVYLLLVAALAGLLLVLVIAEGRSGLRRTAALLAMAGQGVLPDRAAIGAAYSSRGRPITFAFCLAGVVYLWVFWVGL